MSHFIKFPINFKTIGNPQNPKISDDFQLRLMTKGPVS